ncbi:MAG TPA: VOC family protein [Acidobacteriaceae bacterium]|nr:VOC family protein [Acidobacteriaceae bacterium]
MQLTTYLNFSGDCEEALNFYAKTLSGKIAMMMRFGESPMAGQVPAEMQDRIMHATLELPDKALLMGADHPQEKKVSPTGFCVSVQVAEVAEAERIYKELSEGGKVQMAFQKTFWSPGFGMCTDRFGTPWMVNCAAAA